MAFDKLAWQREYRKKNNDACTRKYEKTVNGFLMRLYRNMLSRVTGVNSKKKHLYEGKEILSKADFYEWSNNSAEFHKLYLLYKESNYERKFSPSVDRINPDKGYTLDNMEWVTQQENSRRGAVSKHNKLKEQTT